MWAEQDDHRLDPLDPTLALGPDDRPRGQTNPISVPCSPTVQALAAIFDRLDLAEVTGLRRCPDRWAAEIVQLDLAPVAQSARPFPPIDLRLAQRQGNDLEQEIDLAALVAVTGIDRDDPSDQALVAIDQRLCQVK